MTTVILLDPAIVLDAEDEFGLGLLMDWAVDHRARLGAQAWLHVAEEYGRNALPLPAQLMRLAHRAVGDLLSRSPIQTQGSDATGSLSENYLGSSPTQELLLADLRGLGDVNESMALGSHDCFWDGTVTTVSCVPPPPSGLRINMEPNSPSPAEVRDQAVRYFSSRHVVIIGGQRDASVLKALQAGLGIEETMVRWIPSEKNKRARNLKDVIYGLGSDSILVCVVGKVGHDVSGEVKNYASKRGVKLCESRFTSQVLDDLRSIVE